MPNPLNPFVELGPSPPDDDPVAQADYLRRLALALEQTGNPRVKPLKKKVNGMVRRFAESAKRGEPPERFAHRFAEEMRELRVMSHEFLLTVVNQVRTTLKTRLQPGSPHAKDVDQLRAQKAFRIYAKALHKLIGAIKRGDSAEERQASDMMRDARDLMRATGEEAMAAGQPPEN